MPQLYAGVLRHRITIQKKQRTQNATTGEMSTTWLTVAENVPASVEPLSVREFIASQAMQSGITHRVQIRYMEGLNADMRILHGEKIYNPAGWLPDPESGRVYLTAPCTEGLNDGG